MKINKTKFIILISLVLTLSFLLCSCGRSNDTGFVDYNFKSGYNGLTINLAENYPPREVGQNSNIQLKVELKNEGAYGLSNGELEISADTRFLHVYDAEGREFPSTGGFMEGKSIQNPVGNKEILNFDASVEGITATKWQDLDYFITAIYDYYNELAIDVCIDPSDPNYDIYGGACKVGDGNHPNPRRLGGQGSPLAVIEVEEISTAERVEFRISIKNMGQGQAKKVSLVKAKLGQDEDLDCKFRLTDDTDFEFDDNTGQEALLVCEKYLDDYTASYDTTLYLRYFYTYKLFQKESLRVIR